MPFKAVSDPTRREILELLARRPHSVREIAERFPVSRPAISKHLRLLREAGLAVERKEGRQRFYSLRAEPLREVEGWSRAIVARAAQPRDRREGEDAEKTGAPEQPARRPAPRRSSPKKPSGESRRSRPPKADADDWHVW